MKPRPRYRPPPSRSPTPLAGLLAFVLVVGVCVAGYFLVRWLWATRSYAGQVERARAMLASTTNADQIRAALDRWYHETHSRWAPHESDFIAYLVRQNPAGDLRTRQILACVAGVDFGEREPDWERWYKNYERRRNGEEPSVPRAQRVSLAGRWSASVGLTAWFTTIIPIDGSIFVASLGHDFDDPDDDADGVVRVDGATGTASLWFAPPLAHRGARDIVGIAAADGLIFAACRNGYVYALDDQAQIRWQYHCGAPLVSAPLAWDVNGDAVADIVVVTDQAKVLALHGARGTPLWNTSLATGAGPPLAPGATLALLARGDRAGPGLLATAPWGAAAILSARDGRARTRETFASGLLSTGLPAGARTGWAPRGLLIDRDGWLWSLVDAGGGIRPVASALLTMRNDETTIANLRSLASPGEEPLLIAALTGDYAGRRGGICAWRPAGLVWRASVAGAVWGTPAIADLSGDKRSEIVVTSIEPTGASTGGALTILSDDGHIVRRLAFAAPLECGPVIADIDGDGRHELLVADQAGRLHCFATTGFGPIEWGLPGGDCRNTHDPDLAYQFGQVPFGFQGRWQPN